MNVRGWIVLALGLVACESNDASNADETIRAKLDLDIRDEANVVLERRGDTLDVAVTLSKGFGLVSDGARLSGHGRAEAFPEADMTLYTARFSLAPHAGGPCADEPISLALALERRGRNARLAGSLTPYCGKDVWSGVPARSPLRLSTPPPGSEE
jgi:hypothetical protein